MNKHVPKVALVIGHSYKKQGSVSKYVKYSEWELNEKIVWPLASSLLNTKKIIPIIVYREHGYLRLPNEINAHKPDLIVSHHFNAFSNENANGTEVLYYHTSDTSKHIASIFQKKIIDALGTTNRELRPIKDNKRGARVLRDTKAPCVLLEPIFITNVNDVVKFSKNVRKYEIALKNAIIESLKWRNLL